MYDIEDVDIVCLFEDKIYLNILLYLFEIVILKWINGNCINISKQKVV